MPQNPPNPHPDLLTYTPTPPTHLPYTLPLPLHPLESSYSLPFYREWFASNWRASIYISVLYVAAIFAIQTWMRNRTAYQLRPLLAVWNVGLSVFSLLGTLRTWPEMGWILWGVGGRAGRGGVSGDDDLGGGWHGSVCDRKHHNIGAAFWGLLFTLSKAVELGDTIFIVLRKQPLIFLHWYHHITVLAYTWYTYPSYDATSRWFMVMNFPVHTVMYFYYAMKSLRLPLPRALSMVITSLQLSQMVIGLAVNLYALGAVRGVFSGGGCTVEEEHVWLALGMYASYFWLFGRFFWGSYYGGNKGGKGGSVKVAKKQS